jgi:uncharacterized protein YfcZ (UPF0381/DUF406 family)
MGTTDKEHGIVSTKKSKPKPKKKSSGTSKLRQWINSQLEAKGLSASAAKKDAGKYKTISAAKKAGSLYYTNPKGVIMIAAFASDLDNIPKKKKKSADSKEVGKQRYDMRRSMEKATEIAKDVMSDQQKRSSRIAKIQTAMDKPVMKATFSTLQDIKNVMPELKKKLSAKDYKQLERILRGGFAMSEKAKLREAKRITGGAMNVGGLTQSAMQNGLSRKINPTTGLTMNKGGMMDYRKKGMFYGGGMTRRGR